MQMLHDILDDCKLNVQRFEQVHGGDINQAYCLFTSTEKYFLKVNDVNKCPAMFKKESGGLDLLRDHCSLIIPRVIKHGECGPQQYLLLEWIEKGSPQKDMWEDFGGGLALLHKQPQLYFGLKEDNYIGSLVQKNASHSQWDLFYAECRVMLLVRRLFDSGNFSLNDVRDAESLCKRFKDLFPEEPPALIHGDLWAGNYMITSSGHAAIYDPAVYFGHREMDIGMTMLFGGFDDRFYRSYNEAYPLERDWKKRLQFTQLYPLLVHAVLFGGHYIAATRNILSGF